MKLKMKRKTKTILLSSILICLFVVSFSSTVSAADDPTMSVDFESEYYESDLPIRVNVLFAWAPNAAQRLESVYLDYNINSKVITDEWRIEYEGFSVNGIKRPIKVTLEIPELGIRENDTVWFKVSYIWHTIYGDDQLVAPTTKHRIDVLPDGEKKEDKDPADERTLYIVLGAALAALLIVAFVIYSMRRRR